MSCNLSLELGGTNAIRCIAIAIISTNGKGIPGRSRGGHLVVWGRPWTLSCHNMVNCLLASIIVLAHALARNSPLRCRIFCYGQGSHGWLTPVREHKPSSSLHPSYIIIIYFRSLCRIAIYFSNLIPTIHSPYRA